MNFVKLVKLDYRKGDFMDNRNGNMGIGTPNHSQNNGTRKLWQRFFRLLILCTFAVFVARILLINSGIPLSYIWQVVLSCIFGNLLATADINSTGIYLSRYGMNAPNFGNRTKVFLLLRITIVGAAIALRSFRLIDTAILAGVVTFIIVLQWFARIYDDRRSLITGEEVWCISRREWIPTIILLVVLNLAFGLPSVLCLLIMFLYSIVLYCF